jgi:membrane protein DedA with SNARE-associated domain
MLEYAVHVIQALPPWGVLAFVCFITFAENVFPPSPSDTILVFCGTIIGVGTVGFVPMLLSSTLGSILGFAAMYGIGRKYGVTLIESGRFKFLPLESIHRAEAWFRHYGFWVIIANRFLSGTRAVISLVAGISEMPLLATTILSALSAAVWNAILLEAGAALGQNWLQMDYYLSLYGKVLLFVALFLGLLRAAWYLWRRKSKKAA